MASRAWPHEPTTSTFALVTALRSLTAVVIVADMAQASAFVGLVAGFWHIHWIAGVGVLVSALVAVGVHSAGFTRLELGEKPASRGASEAEEPEEPGDADV
jgi:hypothetical protein